MVTEIVFFDLPHNTRAADAQELYLRTAQDWVRNPDLIEKYCFFDAEQALGGAIYVWPDRAAAERWHGPSYCKMVEDLYGSRPRIQVLDALVHVDPLRRKIEAL